MNEPLIRDSAFLGSPIMSYGQFSARNKWLKLIALATGSFGLLILGAGIWFWFFSSLPLPADSAVMAIIPPGYKMPNSVPAVWRVAAEHNRPLPAVVGLMASGRSDGQLEPFAVRVLDIADRSSNGWSVWRILSEDMPSAFELKTPFQVFGSPWPNKSSGFWLSISPSKVFGLGEEVGLPQVLQGYVQPGIWRVDSPVEESLDQEPGWDTNYLGLSSENDIYLANFTAFYGEQGFGSPAWVHWEHDDGLTLAYKSKEGSETGLVGRTLTVGSLLLPDDYLVHVLELSDSSVYTTRTQSDLIKLNVADIAGFYLGSVPTDLNCPGRKLVAFDEQSLKNICSWTDICFIKLKSLVINKQEQNINFCFD